MKQLGVNTFLTTRSIPNMESTVFPKRLIVLWLMGITALLPVKILNLPHNIELIDILALMGIALVLLDFNIRRPYVVSMSYIIPIWLVSFSSVISSLASPAPIRGLLVLSKELYLFIWFGLVTVFLFRINAVEFRKVLRFWSWVVVCHGLLMILQFFSPPVWAFTNSLGGNSANLENYRAAGLFICDAAGCANKAAFFQLMGFVPLMLSGYSKRKTTVMGLFLFMSLMSTGSMGATIAFTSGLIVAMLTVAFLKNNLRLVVKYFFRFVVVVALLGGIFTIIASQNETYQKHFEKIIVGRFDKSSNGRFGLWQRGLTVLLDHNILLWGVGPENFRVVDAAQTDNQLHNDTLAFFVERGLIGLLGLVLFPIIALSKTARILQIYKMDSKRGRLELVVFVAVIVTTIVESLTHQVFHARELWLVLAVQDAVLYKMMTSSTGIEPVVHQTGKPPQKHNELIKLQAAPVGSRSNLRGPGR